MLSGTTPPGRSGPGSRMLSGTTPPGLSGPGSNGKKGDSQFPKAPALRKPYHKIV